MMSPKNKAHIKAQSIAKGGSTALFLWRKEALGARKLARGEDKRLRQGYQATMQPTTGGSRRRRASLGIERPEYTNW
jgi:hypothetical protein